MLPQAEALFASICIPYPNSIVARSGNDVSFVSWKIDSFNASTNTEAETRLKSEIIKRKCSIILYDSENMDDFQKELSMEREYEYDKTNENK